MKNTSFLLFMLLAILCITACKDDSELSLPKEMVLSKVFREGKLELEYRYNANRQLEQIREYDKTTGLLDYFTEFHYDNRGFLENEIDHNEDEKPTSSTKYLKNGTGQFLSSDFILLTGADSGKVTIRRKYEYNKEGYISKDSRYDPETDMEESFRSFYYYPNGNLEHYEYYWTVEPTPEKAAEVHYLPAAQLPENISKHRGYPINFSLYHFVVEKIEYEIFASGWSPATEYQELITDRVYNSQGLITEQTITTRYIFPEKPDYVVHMKYEYDEI